MNPDDDNDNDNNNINDYITLDQITKLSSQQHMDETFEPDLQFATKLYQIQPINSNQMMIMHVGNMNTQSNILIKEFEYSGYKCMIISRIYNEDQLRDDTNCKLFDLIRLLIYLNDKLIGYLSYSFRIGEMKPDEPDEPLIQSKLSTKACQVMIGGKFFILLYFDEKPIILNSEVQYTTHDNMFNDILDTFIDSDVQERIKQKN